jgi:hypothetical protein
VRRPTPPLRAIWAQVLGCAAVAPLDGLAALVTTLLQGRAWWLVLATLRSPSLYRYRTRLRWTDRVGGGGAGSWKWSRAFHGAPVGRLCCASVDGWCVHAAEVVDLLLRMEVGTGWPVQPSGLVGLVAPGGPLARLAGSD